MKAYEQLATLFNQDKLEMKKAFQNWCNSVGYSEEEGDKELFNIPPELAINILIVNKN